MQDIVGALQLPGVAADTLDLFVKRRWVAQLGFEGHGAGDIGHLGQVFGFMQVEDADGGHYLGAVDQCQAFLFQKHQRLQAGFFESLGRALLLVAIHDFAFTDQDHGQVGQRCQVAGSAHRSLGRDQGDDVFVQHVKQQLHHFQAHAAVTLGQDIGPQQHDAAHNVGWQIRADTGSVALDQVFLQLLQVLLFDAALGQGAETRVDAVVGLVGVDEFFQYQPAVFYFGRGGG